MRVKTGQVRRKRHKKTLKRTKGYRMTKNSLYRVAHEAELHAGQYAFIGRKQKKRRFRQLWISRINAVLSQYQLSYSQFVHQLKERKIKLNRKILANLATKQPKVFETVVKTVQTQKNK